MQIDSLAITTGRQQDRKEADRGNPIFTISYPKDSPVLEGAYIFPKIEGFGVWHYETLRVRTVSTDERVNVSIA